MKIRILGNNVRLRLSQTEVDRLKTEGEVSEKTEFAGGDFIYRMLRHNGPELNADMVNGRIMVTVPDDLVDRWATTEEVSIEGTTDNGVYILIEKDFKCLTERPGEDESDLYANPNESC